MPEVMFAGPDGRLEGRYHHAKKPNAPVALLLHPHPLHGGTMNNRVVHALYQRFQAMGFSVLRFNFRGVGRSQGRYDGGIGEISDAASALDFLQAVNPNAQSLWVAGYSFGAYVGMQLLVEALRKTGPLLTRANLAAALDQMKLRSGLAIQDTLAWRPGSHFANTTMRAFEIQYRGTFGGWVARDVFQDDTPELGVD